MPSSSGPIEDMMVSFVNLGAKGMNSFSINRRFKKLLDHQTGRNVSGRRHQNSKQLHGYHQLFEEELNQEIFGPEVYWFVSIFG